MSLDIKPFFDDTTSTFSYVINDAGEAAVIDPVLDFDPVKARVFTDGAQRIVDYIREQDLTLVWILETHAHADHLTAATWIRQQLGGRTGIGQGITEVQARFRDIYNLAEFPADGSQFDHLFAEDEALTLGNVRGRIINTPGHTSDCITYLFGDAAFVGDTLFAPDFGTARTDFPGGDARQLYRSIRKLLDLPENTRYFLCHDYVPDTREKPRAFFTRAEQLQNVHLPADVTEDAFVAMREARDLELDTPRLIISALQVNIRAGALPPAEHNGKRYLKLPLDTFGSPPGKPWS